MILILGAIKTIKPLPIICCSVFNVSYISIVPNNIFLLKEIICKMHFKKLAKNPRNRSIEKKFLKYQIKIKSCQNILIFHYFIKHFNCYLPRIFIDLLDNDYTPIHIYIFLNFKWQILF